MNKASLGFTLIELLLAIALMLIIAGISTPFYARFLTQNSSTAVQDEIVGQLRKAQTYAMTGRQNGDWGVYMGNGDIVLFTGPSYAARNEIFDETFRYSTAMAITGVTEIIFSRPSGIPNTSGSITITGLGTTKTVIVNDQGMVTR